MNHILYYIVDWPNWLVSTLMTVTMTLLVTSTIQVIARYIGGLYRILHKKVRGRKDDEEQKLYLDSLKLSRSGTRVLGKRKPKARSCVPKVGDITASYKSWPYKRPNYGPLTKPGGSNVLLKAVRVSRGWTLEEAAEALEVDVKTLNRWERGKYRPSREMLPRIIEKYNMPAEDLGYGELEKYYHEHPREKGNSDGPLNGRG